MPSVAPNKIFFLCKQQSRDPALREPLSDETQFCVSECACVCVWMREDVCVWMWRRACLCVLMFMPVIRRTAAVCSEACISMGLEEEGSVCVCVCVH